MRKALAVLIFCLLSVPAGASVDSHIRRLCAVAHPDMVRMQSRCFKLPMTAATRVGDKMKTLGADGEAEVLLAWCRSRSKGDSGDTDWRRTKLCFDRVIRPYKAYLAARAQGCVPRSGVRAMATGFRP